MEKTFGVCAFGFFIAFAWFAEKSLPSQFFMMAFFGTIFVVALIVFLVLKITREDKQDALKRALGNAKAIAADNQEEFDEQKFIRDWKKNHR